MINYNLRIPEYKTDDKGHICIDRHEFEAMVSDALRWAFLRENHSWIKHKDDLAYTEEDGRVFDDSFSAAQIRFKFDQDLSCNALLDGAVDERISDSKFEFSWVDST
jgi:hypothetical protein